MNPLIAIGAAVLLFLVLKPKAARARPRVESDEDEVLVVSSGPQGAPPPPSVNGQSGDGQNDGGFTADYGDDHGLLGFDVKKRQPRSGVAYTELVNPMREKLKGVSVAPGTVQWRPFR